MIPANPNFLQLSTTPLFCSNYTTPFFGYLLSCVPTHFSNIQTTPLICFSISKHNICPIFHVSAILDDTTAAILNEHMHDCYWNPPLLFHGGKQTLDLSKAIGDTVIAPPCVSNQTPVFFPSGPGADLTPNCIRMLIQFPNW